MAVKIFIKRKVQEDNIGTIDNPFEKIAGTYSGATRVYFWGDVQQNR